MKNCRVLVIEDELLVGLDVVWTLENAGFPHVEHAVDEADALHRLHTDTWHAVVADANLNGRGIDQIALLLREKELPFIVVTGYGRENLPDIIGAAPILAKPFSPRDLIRHVQELCLRMPGMLSSPTCS